jgi:GntR family transcriptional regulator/MocR family aminotransferase
LGQLEKPRPSGATRRISESLRNKIADGSYQPGDALPSSRALAEELGVSRTTVTAAFDQLISEGYVVSRQGAPSIVADQLGRSAQPQFSAEPMAESRLSTYANRLLGLPLGAIPLRPTLDFDFRYGDISGADFPTLLWRRALNAALLKRRPRLAYEHPAGNPELRAELRAYLWRARGIDCDADQIVICSGSQQALDLCARILIDPGDRAVVEDPCYAMAHNAIAAAGAEIHAIPCDGNGLMTSELPSNVRASLVFVTPSHQYPLGGVLPAGRRDQLVDWAATAGAYIIEDDYDGEYRYDVKPIPPLYQSGRGRVIYVGTVSKTLSPMLRLGYLVVPRHVIEIFTRCKQVADRHSMTLEQEALAGLIRAGAYERHVRKMRRMNGQRRAALIAALSDSFGDAVEIAGSSAGLHVVVWFRHLMPEHEPLLIEAALKHGIGIYPISSLYLARKPSQAGLVMGYASQSPDALRRGVALLASALNGLVPM